MILVIGGMSSGKKTYVKERFFSGDEVGFGAACCDARELGVSCEAGVLDELGVPNELGISSELGDNLLSRLRETRIVLHAEELARADTPSEAVMQALCAAEAVTMNELGAGIVPADPAERAYRERAGRLAVLLAKEADEVVRMVCGIPVVLKESTECASIF